MPSNYIPGRMSGQSQQNRSRLLLAGLAAAGAMAWVNRNGGFNQVLNKVKQGLSDRGIGGQGSGQGAGQQGSAQQGGAQGLMGGGMSGTAMGGQAPQAGTGGSGIGGSSGIGGGMGSGLGSGGMAHTASGADASGSLNAGIADENTIPDRLPSGTMA